MDTKDKEAVCSFCGGSFDVVYLGETVTMEVIYHGCKLVKATTRCPKCHEAPKP